MHRLAVLDISTFIWDKNHYNQNKPEYYKLMKVLPDLYEGLIKEKIPVVLRGELSMEIFNYFPYDAIPKEYYDFENLTLQFFSNLHMVTYPDHDDATISAIPELVKNHFSSSTKQEVRYLITHLYNDRPETKKMLVFSIFWNKNDKLTIRHKKSVEIETFLCDDPKKHKALFLSFKKIFEHNKKHDEYKSGNKKYHGQIISPISCYNDRLKDINEAQKLLDEAKEYNGSFYNYDETNKTYVRFIGTRGNIYHGFNVTLSETEQIIIDKLIGR
jgi:hypothetical protein